MFSLQDFRSGAVAWDTRDDAKYNLSMTINDKIGNSDCMVLTNKSSNENLQSQGV